MADKTASEQKRKEKEEKKAKAMAIREANLNAKKNARENAKKKGKKKFGSRIAKWFREMKSELKKVVWPTRKQIMNNTLVALVMIAGFAVLLWGLDEIASGVVHILINLAG